MNRQEMIRLPPDGFFDVPRLGAAVGVSLTPRDGAPVGTAVNKKRSSHNYFKIMNIKTLIIDAILCIHASLYWGSVPSIMNFKSHCDSHTL